MKKNKSSRGIFKWVKIDGDILLGSSRESIWRACHKMAQAACHTYRDIYLRHQTDLGFETILDQIGGCYFLVTKYKMKECTASFRLHGDVTQGGGAAKIRHIG